MRSEHYFRQESNNFVRFYITRFRVSAVFVYRLQRVPHAEKCIRSTAATRTVYVIGRATFVVPPSKICRLQKQLC